MLCARFISAVFFVLVSSSVFAAGLPGESEDYAAEYARNTAPTGSAASSHTAKGSPGDSSRGIPLSIDASLAFNPIASLISDEGSMGSRVTLTPAVLLSAQLRPGFEFFFGTQYASHGVPIASGGKQVLASNSVLEFPVGVGFPMRGTFLGEDTIALFRSGLSLNLPLSSLAYQNQVVANARFSYSMYLESGALFPIDQGILVGATARLGIGLSNAYEKNDVGAERPFVFGFAATSRFTL